MRVYHLLGAVSLFILINASEILQNILQSRYLGVFAMIGDLNMAIYILHLLLMRIILGLLTVWLCSNHSQMLTVDIDVENSEGLNAKHIAIHPSYNLIFVLYYASVVMAGLHGSTYYVGTWINWTTHGLLTKFRGILRKDEDDIVHLDKEGTLFLVHDK
jgi:hypothetical protein